MAKNNDMIVMEGVVNESLPNASFRVELERITVPKSRKVSHVRFTMTWLDEKIGGVAAAVTRLPRIGACLETLAQNQMLSEFEPVEPDEKSVQAMMKRVLRSREQLMALRDQNLIELEDRELVVRDVAKLKALSGFNPNYLHLDRET